MGHLVQYRTAAGEPASHDVDGLDEALALAARLRNDERAEDVRVFAEVPLRFETYVKVSVADADVPDAPEADEAPETAGAAEVADVPTPEAVASASVEPPPGAMPLTPASVGPARRMFQEN